MAEADAFIFAALQHNGWYRYDLYAYLVHMYIRFYSRTFCGVLWLICRVEANSTWTVAQLSSDALIVVVLECLAQLKASDDDDKFTLPCSKEKAPVGVAARHRVGSHLANILKELGYAGECGYNHFLYPNEKETRKILSWLVGKLPRSTLEEKEDEVQAFDTIPPHARAVLETEQIASIFSNWMREKTLHLIANPKVKGLRGFQRLPLTTCPLDFPWKRQTQSSSSLFEAFPTDGVKATSVLEALAVAKMDSAMSVGKIEFEDELEVESRLMHGERSKGDKDAECGNKSSHVALKETGDDGAIAGIAQRKLALPDVPLALEHSSSNVTTMVSSEGLLLDTTASIEASARWEKDDVDAIVDGSEEHDKPTLEQMQKQVEEVKSRITAMGKVLDRKRGELLEMEQHVSQKQSTAQELQEQLARQKQVLALLPDADANIAKLNHRCHTNAAKKAEIVQQMESARESLLKECADLSGERASRKAQSRHLLEEIKKFRSEIQEFNGTIHSKTEQLRALEQLQERRSTKLGKNKDAMTRSNYTARIMDIIKQVHKQKQDITKILTDISELQKEVDTTSAKLKRTEALADEKLYTEASKSKSRGSAKADAYIECYRKFAQVRELFDELLVVVKDAGKKENAARDLQNWIAQLEARDSSNNLTKVLADLQSIRLENDALQNELHARHAET